MRASAFAFFRRWISGRPSIWRRRFGQQMSVPEVVQNTKEVTLKSNTPEAIVVNCPEGTKVISGGGGSDVVGASYFAMAWTLPITGQKDEGWSVGIVNRSLTSKKGAIFAFALCSKVK